MSIEVLLLPLNRPTPSGRIYTTELIQGLVEDLKERAQLGVVHGELGSPRARIGLSAAALMRIEIERQCLTVTGVELREDGLYGTIVPSGPLGGEMLSQIIANQGLTPRLSMRALTRLSADTTIVEEVVAIAHFDFGDEAFSEAQGEHPQGLVGAAMDTLIKALADDVQYVWGWYCNIKMSMVDAGSSWVVAAEGSARFLSTLTGGQVDMYKHPFWERDISAARELDAHRVRQQFTEVPDDQHVVHITVTTPPNRGSLEITEAVSQLLGKALPNTPVLIRQPDDAQPEQQQAWVSLVADGLESGRGLEVDTWNREKTAGHQFTVVIDRTIDAALKPLKA